MKLIDFVVWFVKWYVLPGAFGLAIYHALPDVMNVVSAWKMEHGRSSLGPALGQCVSYLRTPVECSDPNVFMPNIFRWLVTAACMFALMLVMPPDSEEDEGKEQGATPFKTQ